MSLRYPKSNHCPHPGLRENDLVAKEKINRQVIPFFSGKPATVDRFARFGTIEAIIVLSTNVQRIQLDGKLIQCNRFIQTSSVPDSFFFTEDFE